VRIELSFKGKKRKFSIHNRKYSRWMLVFLRWFIVDAPRIQEIWCADAVSEEARVCRKYI
jgi:hypothetical protein